MAHESQDGGMGGFYEPWSKRLVTLQGPWEGVDDATTLSIVAHEATHQFENLVLRQMDHAPTFMIEGLATFFEGTVVREAEVICGRISVLRVDELKRAIKSGSYVRLEGPHPHPARELLGLPLRPRLGPRPLDDVRPRGEEGAEAPPGLLGPLLLAPGDGRELR